MSISLEWFYCSLHSYCSNMCCCSATCPLIPRDQPMNPFDLLGSKHEANTMLQAIDGYMGFRDYHFIWPLTLAMAYTVTQQQQGMKVNYMFIEIPAPMMPFAMLLISMFYPNGVQHAIFQAYGLVAAHLYEFLTKIWPTLGGGVNLIPTPPLLVKLVNFLEGRVQDAQQSYNARFGGAPSNRSTSASTSGASVNPPLPDSWRTRGGGRRLG